MAVDIAHNATDKTLYVTAFDRSTNALATGLVSADFTTIRYVKGERALPASVTLSDLSALNDAHADGGFLEVADGVYRLDMPDAAWDTETLVEIVGPASGSYGVRHEKIRVTTIESDVTAVLADTNELQTDWANGGRLDLILDARASQTSVDGLTTQIGTAGDGLTAIPGVVTVTGNVEGNVSGTVNAILQAVTVGGHTTTALAEFLTIDTGETSGSAVEGSVVKEAGDLGGGLTAADVWTHGTRSLTATVTVGGHTTTSLAEFLTIDTGETSGSAVSGSVVKETGTLAGNTDIYHADICYNRDGVAGKDEYTVTWFKNGTPEATAASATIQVVKRDGTDLIAQTNMTQVESSATWKYDASVRAPIGDAVSVVCTADIDSGTRTFSHVVSRDR